ncbi:MAG TPA: phospholipase D family protein [Sphingopyxis sp.]|nr:phospholipase D family protein [Sphingopyxis sp.]HMP44589.1 phospholipase D family protein [Sphingopyxis sp.]HMQ19042.1 phospholipase D family protein [Sphingopyxis sp.]
MAKAQPFQLLLNDDSHDHKAEIVELFENAQRLECLVAFAKHSVWADLKKPLEEALERGMRARFAVGLNFYHTDPRLLRALWRLSRRHDLELYLGGDDGDTFHPKIYAFQYRDGCTVLVGSANFTQGGLSGNHEASVLINDTQGAMMLSVTDYFDELIDNKAIVLASNVRIDQYARDHEINATWLRFAKRRANRAISTGNNSLDALSNFLRLMKEGGTNSDFESELEVRRDNLLKAPAQLRSIAAWNGTTAKSFLKHYERLIDLFHSGGLYRAKTGITDQRSKFTKAVSAIIGQSSLSPHDAFSILYAYFVDIKGAGINLLTEILHTLDNKRFAVMNQNSVSGLRLAGYYGFPQHPLKSNIDADAYQAYCDNAASVRDALGLADFTELDALFNYAYWPENRPQAEGDDL